MINYEGLHGPRPECTLLSQSEIVIFSARPELILKHHFVWHNTAPPRLTKKQDQVFSRKGEDSKVDCVLDKANPLPAFKWEYQNMVCPDFDTKNCQPVETQWMPVPESAIMTPMQTATNKSIVKVQSDQAAARYRCQAFNKLGSDSHIIKFIRRGKRFQCVSAIEIIWLGRNFRALSFGMARRCYVY